MRGPFLFPCKKLCEFWFRRKANEIRNRGASRNYFSALSTRRASRGGWTRPSPRAEHRPAARTPRSCCGATTATAVPGSRNHEEQQRYFAAERVIKGPWRLQQRRAGHERPEIE
jgi:hypothetical protein